MGNRDVVALGKVIDHNLPVGGDVVLESMGRGKGFQQRQMLVEYLFEFRIYRGEGFGTRIKVGKQ